MVISNNSDTVSFTGSGTNPNFINSNHNYHKGRLMAGHSHWAGIKHKKGAADEKRGKLFSKLSKNIMLAIRDGGPDPDKNLKLRYAIDKAKQANMPKTNIERIIKRTSGDDAKDLTELTYEGYGPGGIAILAEIVTDNRNRTASELRRVFSKGGGKLGESGCVSYLFDRKGLIIVPGTSIEEEKLMDIVLEVEADDMKEQDGKYEIYTSPSEFHNIKNSLSEKGVEIETFEVIFIPQNNIMLDEENARKTLKLLSDIDDHDDVQNVYANYDIPDDIQAKLEAE